MLNNCIVKKIDGSIDKELPILGESYLVIENLDSVGQFGYSVYMPVEVPITLKVNQSYFTNSSGTANYGTQIEYDGTDNFFVKPLIGAENTIVYIKNKYAPTKFICPTSGTPINTVIGINNETLAWALNINEINLEQGFVCDELVPPVAFKRLIKLERFKWENYQNPESNWVINDLAEAQIENGRDYNNYPTLKLQLSIHGRTKYYNGNNYVIIPTSTIFIVFKDSGYELHSDTVDGTLLYDSLL